jgi:tRNA(Arg) A34 adenosine deaminase TadA
VAISEQDLVHLRTAVALAHEAFDAGDGPFGTVLVDAGGEVLWTGRNHDGAGDETQHPELAVAQWSAQLSPEVRAGCTVYTSGEHCPMCSAAHGWMGLGRIVYAVSSAQLLAWRQAWGATDLVVNVLPIRAIAPSVPVDGPAPELEDEMRALHRAAWQRR